MKSLSLDRRSALFLATDRRPVMLFALMASLAMLSCSSSTATNTLTCSAGSHVSGSQCVLDSVIITIGPDQQPDPFNEHSGNCPAFHPNPASVKVNQPIQFTNNQANSVTIVGNDNTPWTTVAPGATSGTLFFSTAGGRSYASTLCASTVGLQGDPHYGVVNVTIN